MMSKNSSIFSYHDIEDYDFSDGMKQVDGEFFYYYDLDKLRQPWIREPNFIPTVVVYSLTFLIGIIGNTIVIFTICGDYKQRTNTTMFLVNLAVSDITFLIVCVPYELSRRFIDHWQLGTVLCKVSVFVEMLTAVLTVLNLAVVSAERYVAIVHPMRSRYMCTLGNMRKFIPLIWCMAAIFASPSTIIMTTEVSTFYNNRSSVKMVFCTDFGVSADKRLAFAVYQFVLMFIVPTLTMLFCYVRVVCVLWVSTQHLSKMIPSERQVDEFYISRVESYTRGIQTTTVPRILKRALSDHKSKVLESRKQIIKLLLMIVIAFLLCWGPKLALQILQKLELKFIYTPQAFVVKEIVGCLPFVQSCINPILYCFMSGNFRKSLRIVFYRRIDSRRSTTSRRSMTGNALQMELHTRSSSEEALKTDDNYLRVTFRGKNGFSLTSSSDV